MHIFKRQKDPLGPLDHWSLHGVMLGEIKTKKTNVCGPTPVIFTGVLTVISRWTHGHLCCRFFHTQHTNTFLYVLGRRNSILEGCA